jgi:hypothetical protein
MPGLVPGIHVFAVQGKKQERRGWPGRSPAMTEKKNLFRVVGKNLKRLDAFSVRLCEGVNGPHKARPVDKRQARAAWHPLGGSQV